MGVEGPRGGNDTAWAAVAGGGPLFGRRALLGLGEKDGDGRVPPQADWRLHGMVTMSAGDAKWEGGRTDRVEELSPGKPFLVGFGCRTVAAMW